MSSIGGCFTPDFCTGMKIEMRKRRRSENNKNEEEKQEGKQWR